MIQAQIERIDKLEQQHILPKEELITLLDGQNEALSAYLFSRADAVRRVNYGTDVYVRGLIEFTNYCRNDCYYCGIRRSNPNASRYRLTEEEILGCCKEGYQLGFRTFVLQGGEDPFYTPERIEHLVRSIKSQHPDCAITLSVGEHDRETYQRWFDAGAERYLLRHETAEDAHYRILHPPELSLAHRKQCLDGFKKHWLPGWLRIHGRLSWTEQFAAGRGPAFYPRAAAGDGGHRPFYSTERHPISGSGPRHLRADPFFSLASFV